MLSAGNILRSYLELEVRLSLLWSLNLHILNSLLFRQAKTKFSCVERFLNKIEIRNYVYHTFLFRKLFMHEKVLG